jgi:signal transduction histidine kinase
LTTLRSAKLRALDDEVRELDELSSELVYWMEADARTLERRPVDIVAAVEELVELERAASSREVQVTIHVTENLTSALDPRQFGRALENLVRNAIRYARSAVAIDAHPHDGGIIVRVDDDGPGIPEGDRTRVLEPFVRLDSARSRDGGGAGLGLAIARRIATRHGGTLSIETSPLGGAALVTWWPGSTTDADLTAQHERRV